MKEDKGTNPQEMSDQEFKALVLKRLDRLDGRVDSNTSGIEKNAQGIEKNRQGIEKNAQGIEKNRQGIERNAQGIEKNRQGIERNAQGIERNRQGIERNLMAIKENRREINSLHDTMAFMIEKMDQNMEDFKRFHEMLREDHRSEMRAIRDGFRGNRDKLDDHENRITRLEEAG